MTRNLSGARLTDRVESDRGVSLIHVAIAIFVLTMFTAVVLDQGVLLLARGQAQNVADAAALSGVAARALDEPGDADPAVDGLTERSIQATIARHTIYGADPSETGRTWSWTCPPGLVGWCVKVDVYRDGTNDSTQLPVYFGGLFGATSQRIKATATAIAKPANGSRCLKPWLIPDVWEELVNPPNAFNVGDNYAPPSYTSGGAVGTGYQLPRDLGRAVLLKPGQPSNAISPSDYFEIETATDYEENIIHCQIEKGIGATVTSLPGNRVGPTNHGLDQLLAASPTGYVDVVIGMFSPVQFYTELAKQTGTFELTIVNMLAVRVSGRQGNEISGVIVGGVGDDVGGSTPAGAAGMLKAIQLIR